MSRFYDTLREARRPTAAAPDAADAWATTPEAGEGTPARNGSNGAGPISQTAAVVTDTGAALEPLLAGAMPDVSNHVAPTAPASNGATSSNGVCRTPLQIQIDALVPVLPNAADSAVVEHYRRLRTKLLQEHANRPFRTLLVASPNPQEGKTVTVLNLALSFAMLSSLKVLAVDGDLRRGSMAKLLGQDERPGLSNLLVGTATLDDVIIKPDNLPIHFITRGDSQTPGAELLNSPRLKRHLDNMAERFDLVLLDSPPVNLLTDTHLLAASCDATLLVARAFFTTRRALEQAIAELRGARIVGTVLNGGTRAEIYRRYNGYYDGK